MGGPASPGYTAAELSGGIVVMVRRSLRILVIVLLGSGAAGSLLGCGQKGPLYFPEEEGEKKEKKKQSLVSPLRASS